MPRKRIGTERIVYTKPNELIYLLNCHIQRMARHYSNALPDNLDAKQALRRANILHRMVDEFLNTGKATQYEAIYY